MRDWIGVVCIHKLHNLWFYLSGVSGQLGFGGSRRLHLKVESVTGPCLILESRCVWNGLQTNYQPATVRSGSKGGGDEHARPGR